MIWTMMTGNDNKNPWGRPGRPGGNPWGNGGGDGGGGPGRQDFDEAFRRMQENFGQFVPGNLGPVRVGIIIVLAAIALWLASGFYIVQPGEHAVIQRFGGWNRTKTVEGLGYRFPAPVESVTKVNVNEIRRLNIGFSSRAGGRGAAAAKQDVAEESLMLTADRNIVDLDLVIQWNVKSAEDFLFNVQDPEVTVKQLAESAIREAVGQTLMFPIITTERDLVAQKARDIIQKNLDEYDSGVTITQVLIQQAEVHPDVQSAFQDVQSAKQDGEDVQNRAQAYREDIIPKARGQAIQLLQEAQGYKQSTVAKATGDAARFESVYESYLKGQDVTKQRMYIETMEDVLKNAQKIIIDDKNGAGQGVVPYLPLNEMMRTAPAAKTQQTEAGGMQ